MSQLTENGPNPIQEIRETFQAYTDAFSRQDSSAFLGYYYYPTLIIDREKSPVVLDGFIGYIKGKIGLSRVFRDLNKRNFSHSQLDGEPQVQILREDVAIASGQATRWSKDKTVLEQFQYTYTFRKRSNHWKIVGGVIH